jgi:hypothetical protein
MEFLEIIKVYFENLYSNKFENLEEMNRLLHNFDHPKLKQEDINHLNKSVTQNKLKHQSRVSQKRKVQDLMDSLLNSIRPLKKN